MGKEAERVGRGSEEEKASERNGTEQMVTRVSLGEGKGKEKLAPSADVTGNAKPETVRAQQQHHQSLDEGRPLCWLHWGR
jgi:hypothetical protein